MKSTFFDSCKKRFGNHTQKDALSKLKQKNFKLVRQADIPRICQQKEKQKNRQKQTSAKWDRLPYTQKEKQKVNKENRVN